jgi:PAS domain S-box-containing protein
VKAHPGSAPALERAALAAALDPIVTIDHRGMILSVSDSVRRVLGWDPSELVGKNVRVLMPEPHRSSHDGYLAKYRETGRTHILNRPRRFEAVRKDGRLVPIELCVSRADVPGGGAPLFVGIIRDMSRYAEEERSREEERVRSQELLAEQTAALQTAHLRLRMADRMASIGTLAAGLGHDMNNVLLPVRARLNALRAACESGAIPAGEGRHVEEIRKSVAYLQQLADGLHFLALDPDADETRGGESGGEATNLREWWGQAGVLISKAVPKHVRVSAKFQDGLPAVAVAPHRLTQAVLNLVVNAGEAIPAERKRKQGMVRLWAERAERAMGEDGGGVGRAMVRIGVTDNGAGMSDEVKRRAFEMFFTTKPRGLGTGLGLALVRRVTEHAGGRVDIQSEVGKGTTIVMTVPSAESRADEARGPTAGVSIADGRAASLVRHILGKGGAKVVEGAPEGDGVWVVDPGVVGAAQAQAWKRSGAGGGRRLVRFGPAGGGGESWDGIADRVIERTGDLQELQAVFGTVLNLSRR